MSAEQIPAILPALANRPQLHIAGLEETLEAQLERKLIRFQELRELMKEYRQLSEELRPLFDDNRPVKVGRVEVHPKPYEVSEKVVHGHAAVRLHIR